MKTEYTNFTMLSSQSNKHVELFRIKKKSQNLFYKLKNSAKRSIIKKKKQIQIIDLFLHDNHSSISSEHLILYCLINQLLSNCGQRRVRGIPLNTVIKPLTSILLEQIFKQKSTQIGGPPIEKTNPIDLNKIFLR